MEAVNTLRELQANVEKLEGYSALKLDLDLTIAVQKVNVEAVAHESMDCKDIAFQIDDKDFGRAWDIDWDQVWDLAEPINDNMRQIEGKRIFMYDTSYAGKQPSNPRLPWLTEGVIEGAPTRMILLKGKSDSISLEAKQHGAVVMICPSPFSGGGVEVKRNGRNFQMFEGAMAFTPGPYTLKGITMGIRASLHWDAPLTPRSFVPDLHSEDVALYEYPVEVTRDLSVPDSMCFVLQHEYQHGPRLYNLVGFDKLVVDSLRARGYRLEIHVAAITHPYMYLVDKKLNPIDKGVTRWFPLGYWHRYNKWQDLDFTYAVVAHSPKRKLKD